MFSHNCCGLRPAPRCWDASLPPQGSEAARGAPWRWCSAPLWQAWSAAGARNSPWTGVRAGRPPADKQNTWRCQPSVRHRQHRWAPVLAPPRLWPVLSCYLCPASARLPVPRPCVCQPGPGRRQAGRQAGREACCVPPADRNSRIIATGRRTKSNQRHLLFFSSLFH